MQTHTFKLSGLTCPACKKVTEKRIGGIHGVKKVEVSIDTGIATIEADRTITVPEIKTALNDTPYHVMEI